MNATDPFTEAARAEALRAWHHDPTATTTPLELAAHMAEWARTHLAAQEPTDEEVEAVLRTLIDWDMYGPDLRKVARTVLEAAREAQKPLRTAEQIRTLALHQVAEHLPFGVVCLCGAELADLNAPLDDARIGGRQLAIAVHQAQELEALAAVGLAPEEENGR